MDTASPSFLTFKTVSLRQRKSSCALFFAENLKLSLELQEQNARVQKACT